MSMSVNRILSNRDNLARTASIVASAQRASTDIRLLSASRKGGGRVAVAGSYTGAADTEIDVEIVSGTGGELTASTPVVRGVGNGLLAVTAIAPTAEPQTITATLLETGTPAKPALLEFFGTTLAARTPGAAGNALSLSVTRNLTATALPFATLDPISAGADNFDGVQWDWGQPQATDSGIPLSALRVQFEGFPTVHRAWKTWEGGRFVYRIDPPAPYDVPADTRLLSVSGNYTLALTNGVATETYTAVTVFDFLGQVAARSALAVPRGAVALDRAPGGMAVTDIPLRTDAHALPAIVPTNGIRLEVIEVDPAAPTENITLTRQSGAGDAWTVVGGVSGTLPNARTDVEYDAGKMRFRIVPPPQARTQTGARISAQLSLAARAEDEGVPSVCFKPLVLGASASDKQIVFTYRARPPADCVCEELPPLAVSMRWLGLEDADMSEYDPAYLSRVKAVYAWRETFVRANTRAPADPSGYRLQISIAGGLAVHVGNYTTPAAAEAAKTAWTGVTVTSGYGFAGETIVFSNGAVGVLGTLIGAEVSGANLAGSTSSASQIVKVNGGAVVFDFAAAGRDLDWMEQVLSILLLPLPQVFLNEDALAAWDALWVEIQADLALLLPSTGNDLSLQSQARYMDRYRAAVDNIYLEAGILPKPEASSGAGSCWQDDPSATHWWVDDSGEYLPAFTGRPYISAALDAERQIISTQEFGFGIVTPCGHRLKEGDRITITIRGTAQGGATGDKITIPVIAGQPAAFAGGEAGDPTQTWAVRGSVSGALPDWLYNPVSPAPHNAGPVTMTLAPGGVPFEQGDQISFALEGGTLRWRRDGGAWTTGDIYGVTHALGNGLTLAAQPGAAPSFVAGDRWTYRALATYGISRLRQPRVGEAFAWDGAAVTLDVDLGTVQPVEAVLLALHSLPGSCVISVTGGELAVGEWTVTPAWHPSALLAVLPAGTSARYLRVSVTGAGAGAAIGWLWAGKGWQPTVGASDLTLRRQYGLARGQGLNPVALYRGRGMGGAWRWDINEGAALEGTNADALLALIDHTAEQGMEPVCVVPDMRDPARAAIAVIDADEVVMVEHNNWQSSAAQTPLISVELPFRAVIA